MRTLLLVVVVFAAGYGAVTISIQTGAYAVGNAVLATVSQKVRNIGRQASDLFHTPEKPVYRKRQAPAEKRETPVEKRKRPVEERQAAISDHPETESRAPDRQAPVKKREQPPEERNAPVEEQAVTFSDYLETANRAFVAMDRSCSEADRTRLGRAYYRLVAYAHDLASRKPANPAGSAADNRVPNLSDFDIFEQVIDATRRGGAEKPAFQAGRRNIG